VNRASGELRVGTRSAWFGRVNDDPLVKPRPARLLGRSSRCFSPDPPKSRGIRRVVTRECPCGTGGLDLRQFDPTSSEGASDKCKHRTRYLPFRCPGETHRDHAIIEQVIAELKDGPLAHAPSGKFTANAAWLALACLSLRAAGAAASARHAKARWSTLRTHLIAVPARIASSAPRLLLHLPTDWPWAPAWEDLWATATP